MDTPTADVSARLAWPQDAAAIASVQVRAWRAQYASVLPADVLDALDVEEIATAWRAGLDRPTEARNRVLVALRRNEVVGFVVTGPAPDPDTDPGSVGELSDLTVAPEHQRAGHGSRLLQAGVDTLLADRFTQAVTWITATDDAMRGFLAGAGWGPDSAHRELDLDGTGRTTVRQVRLHTLLTDPPGPAGSSEPSPEPG